jgi:hypothetical protein
MALNAKVIKEAEHRDLDHAAKQMPKRLNSRIPNVTEGAYNRGDLFDKRRSLMESWGQFVSDKRSNVISIAREAS